MPLQLGFATSGQVSLEVDTAVLCPSVHQYWFTNNNTVPLELNCDLNFTSRIRKDIDCYKKHLPFHNFCTYFNFPGEPEFLQIWWKDQHPPASAAHRFQWSEHHWSHSCVAGWADPQPCSRAPGHRQSASDWTNQVRRRGVRSDCGQQ